VTENPELVDPPLAVPDQELQAASATTVATPAALNVALIQIIEKPLVPPHAPPPPADPDDTSVVIVNHWTLDKRRREARTQTQTTSRSTICLSLWLFLLFSSSVHGITYNCINKNTPSSSCCFGEITLDPTMTSIVADAFYGCSGLNGSLIIPSSVGTIGERAFIIVLVSLAL
jgi:hypothetical protein